MHLAKVLKLCWPLFFLRLRGVQKKPLLATPGWAKFGLDKELLAYTQSLRCIRKIQENTEGVIIPSQFTSQGSVRFLQPFCYFTGHRIQRLQFTQSSKHVEKLMSETPCLTEESEADLFTNLLHLVSTIQQNSCLREWSSQRRRIWRIYDPIWSNMIQWSWWIFSCFFPMYIEAF